MNAHAPNRGVKRTFWRAHCFDALPTRRPWKSNKPQQLTLTNFPGSRIIKLGRLLALVMRQKRASIAKITLPRVSGVVRRERLFRLLDRGAEKPLAWIAAPAGSGKTALIASWLEARKLPHLWYQLDAGDADPATFFHYLGMAAAKANPRRKKPLPPLTPEYLMDIPTFSRRSFEKLCAGVRTPFVIVFDNHQDVPADAPLHAALASGIAAVPEGVRIVCLSRTEPSPLFSGLIAGSKMETMGWDDLRLNLEETRAIIGLHSGDRQDRRILEWMHERTQGWAAGLVLMAKAIKDPVIDHGKIDALPRDNIFDYFATELFSRTDGKVRDFLIKTSLLPTVSPAVAERLTGLRDAGAILDGLHRRNYFTYKSERPVIAYQYHPLFREFLLARSGDSFTPRDLRRFRKDAARLLEGSGQTEDAAGLYRESEDWEGLIRVVLGSAQMLMAQGRWNTLREWLAAIPPSAGSKHLWLRYWTGVCAMATDPAESRKQFTEAFTRFRAARDAAGMHLAWAGAVDTFFYEGNDFRGSDKWIAWLDGPARKRVPFPSPEVEARSAAGMAHLLLWRRMEHPDIKSWIERAVELSRGIPDLTFQVQARQVALLYAVWMGDFSECPAIIEDIRRRVRSATFSPLAMVLRKGVEAVYHATVFDSERALLLTSEGLDLARAHGIHVLDAMLMAQGVYASLNRNDAATASRYLDMMRSVVSPVQKINYAIYQHLLAWHGLLTGNVSEAAVCAEKAAALAEETGPTVPRITAGLTAAQALYAAGDRRKAARFLAGAKKLNQRAGSRYLAFVCHLVEAHFAFSRGDSGAGLRALSSGMTLGRRENLVSMHYLWQPGVMAELCARALAGGIEPEYARKLVRELRLAGQGPPHEEAWPWPVKVFVLGGFEVRTDDTLMAFPKKTQKKPLQLLKVLIARGGRPVREEELADLLWPDSEGDAGRKSVNVTVVRLRNLLGKKEAVMYREGNVSLDRRQCWVDAWAFEEILERAGPQPGRRREQDGRLDKALTLYRGPFLPGEQDSWTISYRERLRDRLLRQVETAGRGLELAGNHEKAVSWYQKGIDADELAEPFYQRLIACYRKLGRRAEALSVYRRCRERLAAYGIGPSADTEALHARLAAKR